MIYVIHNDITEFKGGGEKIKLGIYKTLESMIENLCGLVMRRSIRELGNLQ